MLPAKFRGFASRVGRLASRAFAWHKISECDGALNATSSATVSSATSNCAASNSSASNSVFNFADSDSDSNSSESSSNSTSSNTAVTSVSARTSRTARPSHTLRRALFAMLVAAATIVTMLIVPPVKQANAASVWWDYAGNGYIAATTEDSRGRKDEPHTYDASDAFRDMRIEDPVVEKENGRTKVTYKIIFNRNAMFARQLDSGEMQPKGNKPKDGAAYLGKPTLSVFLPKGLDKSTILVKRYWEGSSGKIQIGDTSAQLVREDQTDMRIGTLKKFGGSWTAWTYTKDPSDSKQFKGFNDSWNDNLGASSGDNGVGGGLPNPYKYSRLEGSPENCQYGMCEIYKWNNKDLFETLFASLEWDTGDKRFTWIVSAYLADGYTEKDVYTRMPVAAGFRSSWRRNKYAVFGPFDTDGDGIPDYVEHLHNMNPKGVDDIEYPQYKDSILKDYGKDNVPLTTYGRPVTVKPIIKTGKWEGDSSKGKFVYDGGTSSALPDDIGIKYSLVSKSDNSIQTVNSPNNMPEGSVYINPKSGYITYNPRKTDKYKTFTFGTKITYPNPELYNCNNSKTLEYTHDMKVKVIPQSWIYNPVYTPVDLTEKTGENQRDVIPIVYTAKPRSVKDSSKKHADSIQDGDLPKDATFELKQYTKQSGRNALKSDPLLDWSRIENQDKNNGKVRFYSNKWREPVGKYRTPVVVHYADGSSSTDDDAANVDARGDFSKSVVYASVNLKRPNPNDSELKLNIHKGYGRNNLGDNGSVTIDVNDPLKPSIWIDSWAQYQIGQISLKSLCWKETKEGNSVKKENYTFSDLSKTNNDNTINGLTFKQTEKWPHASDKEQETCFANGTCSGKKLFDKDAFTIERSRGEISGTPKKGGKYVCRVFALRDGSQAKTDFDKAVETKNYNVSLPTNSQKYDWQSKTVNFVVHSLAHKYNPQYIKVNVKVGHKGGVTSAAPVSQSGSNGVKGDDKSQNDLVPNGTRLPKGTWFELKKYKDSKTVLSWSKFEGKQSNKKSGKDEPDDTSSEEKYGKVTFVPPNGTLVGEYSTPVIVHYPDGSTSEDPDSGNLGKPVYAPVSVTDQDIQDDDLKLRVYSQYGGRQIGDNDRTGIRFRPGEVLGDDNGNTKPMFFDSWSSAKPGKIYQRMLCYKLGADNKRSDYTIDGVNGLTLAGREGNTLDGKFTSKPSQWTRANNEQRNECKADGSKCNHNLYLYGDEYDTTERTWGWLRGKVNNNGDYVCTVYAIKDLENKDGKHGNLQTKFDTELKKFVENPGDKKFEDVISKSVLKDQKGSKNNPIDATQRHVDWDSVTFPIHVHRDAHYYNPQYTTLTMEAGTKQDTALPQSKKTANGADKLQDDVREGDLPDGTWFELKGSLSYAFFEDDQDNKADSSDSAKNPTGKFGKVTFRPHRWFPAAPDKTQVIVHYPDGSKSTDSDSGNNGKPIYASVNVTRSHDETPGNLHLNVGDKEGSGDWSDTTIRLTKGEELKTSTKTTRWLDSWSVYKPGKINLRTICYKINSDGTQSHYQSGGIAGITMQNPKIWNHTEDAPAQKACEKDRSKCHPDTQLYDDYITNGDSRDTTERTRGWIKGTANETGDYECVVYAIKATQFTKDNYLLNSFDKAVAKLNKDASKNNTDPLKDFKWKLDGDNGKKDAVEGVDYAKRPIPIQIHTQAHNYNPVYDKVTVQAGKQMQSGLPKNKKPTGDHVNKGSLAYKAIADGEAFPDGTWFELKKEASSPATYDNAYDWSFWKKGLKGQNDSNAPNDQTNPLNHKGKDSSLGSGSKYGNVTFHPDVTISPKDYYQTHVIVHYPDGSNSDDPDAGNNQFKASASATSTMNPVFAKVQVTDLGYRGTDLRMTLTKSKDTDSSLDSRSALTVMKGIGLLKNPFVQAWSVKDKGKINLRMMCTKDSEDKWSRGLEDTLNMHLGNNYGENTPEWNFATEEQQKNCRENGICYAEHVLYGLMNTDNAQAGSVESAVARREEEIEGDPKETGTYSCSVFALKDKALTAFNQVVGNASYTSTDMWNVNLSATDSSLVKSKDWDRISFKVNVVNKFALPKTGGEGMSMALLVVAMIAMCVMCGAFFVDQTKWGHAMLAGAAASASGVVAGVAGAAAGIMRGLRSTTQNSKISEVWRGLVKKVKNIRRFDEYCAPVKDFVCKVTGWLRAAFRRVGRWATERWRC
ncbi:Rib/alpha-like domain-containing protein [Gardnerella vaginalis]|uniref:Rib/alpha-like domain-containing protein n=1 Tax=Gardnerella vaginalis TaxID=2702 RepID=UPI0005181C1A|nr:Rib/alpha-like domain-containing protein [Gardnerella vaginalis]